MKLHKKHIKYFVFLLIILYGFNNDIFERIFFFNEILACVGIFIFASHCIKKNWKVIIPKSSLLKLILIFWLLCGFHLLISIFTKTNWYFYLRNAVILYSSFTFFIGFYWHLELKSFLRKIKILLTLVTLSLMPSRSTLLLDRFSIAIFFPFFFKTGKYFSLFFLLVLNFLYAYFFASMTAALIGIILVGIIILPRYVYFQASFIVIISFAVIIFTYLTPSLKLYKEGSESYRLFGNVHHVYQDNPLLQIDGNSSWRTILWYRVIVEEFPKNMLGLGFGTPLLPYRANAKTAESYHDDEHDAHVIGVHNTYITLFARLGIFVLVIFYFLYSIIFKEFYYFRQFYINNQDYPIFLAFFTISIIGLFNLVLESPIYAGLYWFLLGLLARIIFERRNQYANTTNT